MEYVIGSAIAWTVILAFCLYIHLTADGPLTIGRFIEWIATKLGNPRVIWDREGKAPYLSRWYLRGGAEMPDGSDPFDFIGAPKKNAVWRKRRWTLHLHKFHRSDDDLALHNHPWDWSLSLILAGGYVEERRDGDKVVSKVFHPWSLNFIRHDTFHRVDLMERDCWTLFLCVRKTHSWGFWDRVTGVYKNWREFIDEKRAA